MAALAADCSPWEDGPTYWDPPVGQMLIGTSLGTPGTLQHFDEWVARWARQVATGASWCPRWTPFQLAAVEPALFLLV
jgi:hypothetical protein